jgi:hypothetical protein
MNKKKEKIVGVFYTGKLQGGQDRRSSFKVIL